MPIKLYRRPNGFYHLRGTHFGVRIDRSAGTCSRREAQILASRLEAEIFEAHAYGAKAVALFAEAATGYMRGGGEAAHLEPIIEAFGARRLRDISQADLDALALKLHPAAADSTRLRRVYTPFIAAWNWAVADDLAEPRKWKKPKPGAKRIDWRTPEEVETLLGALPKATKALAIFYVGTGARATEALDLQWPDVSPDRERATFWETKSEYARHVDLQPRVREALPKRLPEGRVFLHTLGEPWHGYDAVNLALKRACKVAGLRPLSCHVLRHTWATWAYATTRNLTYVMQQGGWKSAQLAMRYAHAASPDVARAAAAYGWSFGEALGR
jgi:integrase